MSRNRCMENEEALGFPDHPLSARLFPDNFSRSSQVGVWKGCRLLDVLTITFGSGRMSARPTDQNHSEADYNSRIEPHISLSH